MIPLFPNDIRQNAECIIVGCRFFTESTKNLGKRVRAVRRIEEGVWLCRPMSKGVRGVNSTTGLIGIKATWLMKISDPTSGLKGNVLPVFPNPSGAAKTLSMT